MNTLESKRIIEEYFEIVARDKQEAIDKFVVDEHLKDHIVMTEEGMPGYQLHAEDMIAEGDKVACRCQAVGTHTGTLFGIPPSGNNVKVPLFIIYQVQNGKIVDHWMQLDTLSFMQQIGAIPVAG